MTVQSLRQVTRFTTLASAVEAVATLTEAECDGGEGEFDGPCDVLIRTEFLNVIEWEVSNIAYDNGIVPFYWLWLVLKEV